MFPFITVPENTKTADLPIFREIAWDFESDTPVAKDGKLVMLEKDDAIKVWVYKAMLTERYRYQTYSWNYGNEIWDLIGSAVSAAAKQSEAKRFIQECLLVNPYIKSVENITAEINEDKMKVEFTVKTIYGEVSMVV